MFCKLLSCVDGIPDQYLRDKNETLIIGRNISCQIRDTRCSRQFCQVKLLTNTTHQSPRIDVHFLKSNQTFIKADGDFIDGPGFKYKIVIIDETKEQENGKKHKRTINDIDDGHERKKMKLNSSPKTETVWEKVGDVYVCKFLGGFNYDGYKSSSGSIRVASFDFDGTLVSTKSGAKFAKSSSDWKIFSNSLAGKINKLVKDDGYQFILFTNQMGVTRGHQSIDEIKTRIEQSLTEIDCPCLVFVATGDDINRKPRPGMFNIFRDKYLNIDNDKNREIDYRESFYVGDAAGRKSDHSLADILFSINIELPFLTPEEFLANKKAKPATDIVLTDLPKTPSFDPRTLRTNDGIIASLQGTDFRTVNELLSHFSKKNSLHIIVNIGFQASGKSTFFQSQLSALGYKRVSRDELKTMEKCEQVAEKHLQQKCNVVVDNTNIDVNSRSRWIQLAKRYSATVVAFVFGVGVGHALHNNTFRRLSGQQSAVNEIVIRSANKNFVPPTEAEGFKFIYVIHFVPHFENKKFEKLYYMFLNDK